MARKHGAPGRAPSRSSSSASASLYGLVALAGTWKPALGLDLQGGTRITLTAKGDVDAATASRRRAEIIDQRVNGSGVSEAEVTTQGNKFIVVEIPGQSRARPGRDREAAGPAAVPPGRLQTAAGAASAPPSVAGQRAARAGRRDAAGPAEPVSRPATACAPATRQAPRRRVAKASKSSSARTARRSARRQDQDARAVADARRPPAPPSRPTPRARPPARPTTRRRHRCAARRRR